MPSNSRNGSCAAAGLGCYADDKTGARLCLVCGRFASSSKAGDLVLEFRVCEAAADQDLPANYNVAPTDPGICRP
jgi:hypothetical protein